MTELTTSCVAFHAYKRIESARHKDCVTAEIRHTSTCLANLTLDRFSKNPAISRARTLNLHAQQEVQAMTQLLALTAAVIIAALVIRYVNVSAR